MSTMPSSIDRRAMLKTMLSMAWPIMVEEGLQTAVSYVDTAMVGQLGPYASAAVGISQTPSWLIWGLLRAASIGLIAYVAQAMGAGDYKRTRRAGGQALLMTAVVGLVIGLAACLCAPHIPRWMGAESDIQAMAGRYFLILCAPMIFRSATINLGAVIRATGDMRTPMVVNAVVNGVNIVLNFLLIYPRRTVSLLGRSIELWGADMGVEGAAIASALAIVLGGVLMVVALYRNPYVSPRGGSLRPDREIIRYNVGIAVPASLQHIVACSGLVVFVALVARLGTLSLAAHTIANTAEQAFYIPAYGLQGVAATMIGMSVGEGNEPKADGQVRMLCATAFGVMAVLGALLFIFARQMMGLFTTDPQVIALGEVALRIVAVAEPFFGVYVVIEGVLRGVGNVKPMLYISLACMWGVRVLFTWVCIELLGLGLASVWLCMTADNVARFVCYMVLFKGGRWKRKVRFVPPEAAAPENS